MIKQFLIIVAALGYASSSAIAGACPKGSEMIFSCIAAKGKVIQVCDSGKTIDYSFGKPSTPEIVVRAPRNDTSTYQWQGLGRSIAYSVQVPNGNTTYIVFWSLDRATSERLIDAGVTVEVNKQTVATVKCLGEKHIVQNIEGIDLKPIE